MIPYYIFLQFFYLLSFYLVHVRRQSKTESKPLDSSFSLKESASAYLKGEGKYFLWIYAVLAIFTELGLMIGNIPVLSILVFVGEMIFPFTLVIPLPIVRTIFTYTFVATATVALRVYDRYRIFSYWNTPSKNH